MSITVEAASANEGQDPAEKALLEQIAAVKASPSEAGFAGMTRDLVSLVLDQTWPDMLRVVNGGRPFLRPAVDSPIPSYDAGLTRTPPRLQGDRIVFPAFYFASISDVSAFLAHDLTATKGSSFNRLAGPRFEPYAESAIWPLLDHPGRYLAEDWSPSLEPLLACPSATGFCQRARNTAAEAAILFALSHEVAHAMARDTPPSSQAYPLEAELAADHQAIKMLRTLEERTESSSSEQRSMLRAALYGAPILLLALEESVLRSAVGEGESGAAAFSAEVMVAMEERRAALISLNPEDVAPLVRSVTESDAAPTRFGTLRFTMALSTERLHVNGRRVAPTEVEGRALTLLAGRYPVVAVSEGRIACAELTVAPDRETIATLEYLPLPARPGSLASVTRLLESGDRCAVLRATTDASLEARREDLRERHREALVSLGLGPRRALYRRAR